MSTLDGKGYTELCTLCLIESGLQLSTVNGFVHIPDYPVSHGWARAIHNLKTTTVHALFPLSFLVESPYTLGWLNVVLDTSLNDEYN
jgi:hypothetical protein